MTRIGRVLDASDQRHDENRPATGPQLDLIAKLRDEKPLDDAGIAWINDRLANGRFTKASASKTITRLLAIKTTGQARRHPANDATIPAADVVPEGRYAVPTEDGALNKLAFYKVDRPTEGKWAGYVFVKLMLSDNEQRMSKAAGAAILAKIAQVGAANASAAYGREFKHCGVCGRGLTNDESRKVGIGPDCRAKLGWTAPVLPLVEVDDDNAAEAALAEADRFDDGYWDRQVQLAERAEDERVAAYKMARDGF